MGLVLHRPICKGCGGKGYVSNEGLVPRTCEVCDGEGVKTNPLVTLLAIITLVVTTIGPIWYYLR